MGYFQITRLVIHTKNLWMMLIENGAVGYMKIKQSDRCDLTV